MLSAVKTARPGVAQIDRGAALDRVLGVGVEPDVGSIGVERERAGEVLGQVAVGVARLDGQVEVGAGDDVVGHGRAADGRDDHGRESDVEGVVWTPTPAAAVAGSGGAGGGDEVAVGGVVEAQAGEGGPARRAQIDGGAALDRVLNVGVAPTSGASALSLTVPVKFSASCALASRACTVTLKLVAGDDVGDGQDDADCGR